MNVDTSGKLELNKKSCNNKLFLLISVCSIIVLSFIIYSNIYDNSMHFDDITYMEPFGMKEFGYLREFFDVNPFRFITFATFSINYNLSGFDLWGYYFFNIIVHIINGLLVFSLINLTFRTPAIRNSNIYKHKQWLSLLGALIFIAHPIQTQAVTYLYQRLTSLSAMFYLLTLTFYLTARLTERKRVFKFIIYSLSGLSFLFAIFTKENSFTLPVAIILFELCLFRTKGQRLSKKIFIPFGFLLIAGVAFLTLLGPSKVFIELTNFSGERITSWTYLLAQFKVIPYYFFLYILPIKQNVDHDFPIINSFWDFDVFLGLLINLTIIAIGFLTFRKKPLVSFGIFWIYITLAVESSIIPILDVMNEHRMYLPMFGFVLILLCLVNQLLIKRNQVIGYSFLGLLILTYSIMTYLRNDVWQNEITLWEDVVKKSPNKARPNNNLALAYLADANFEKSIEYFSNSIRIMPEYSIAYHNRAFANMHIGMYKDAVKDFSEYIKIEKKVAPDVYLNRGNAYFNTENYKKSIVDYTKYLEMMPNDYNGHYNRSQAYFMLKDFEGAKKDLREAVNLNRNDTRGYSALGDIELALENYEEAIKHYTRVVEIIPDDPLGYNNRGSVYFYLNQYEKALRDFKHATSLDPNFVQGLANIAAVYRLHNDFKKELFYLNRILKIDPNNVQALFDRAKVHLNLHDKINARKDATRVLELQPNSNDAKEFINNIKY
ncbi:MAG: tetratricopeptide repeat protein [Ignavibacteria bacterium]|nr:tetratricopeptide repeat protein [Ignavibacteria bacterium]